MKRALFLAAVIVASGGLSLPAVAHDSIVMEHVIGAHLDFVDYLVALDTPTRLGSNDGGGAIIMPYGAFTIPEDWLKPDGGNPGLVTSWKKIDMGAFKDKIKPHIGNVGLIQNGAEGTISAGISRLETRKV